MIRLAFLLSLLTGCSALPATRGSIADRLEPIAVGLDEAEKTVGALQLLVETVRESLRTAGSRSDEALRAAEGAQRRAANAEETNRRQADALDELRAAGVPEEALGWLQVALIALGVTGTAAVGTAGAKAGTKAVVRRVITGPRGRGPGGGPVSPDPAELMGLLSRVRGDNPSSPPEG